MNKKSFTLIELLVVIAIIGILSSLVIARFSNWNDNAKIANTLQWSAGAHRKIGSHLINHWPLNGSLNDISGYNNHGKWKNTDNDVPDGKWVPGAPGSGMTALSFNGVDDYVRITKNYNLDNFSFSLWAQAPPQTKDFEMPLMMTGQQASSRIQGDGVSQTFGYFYAMDDLGNSSGYLNFNSPGLFTNVWIHLLLIVDGADLRGYVNGKLVWNRLDRFVDGFTFSDVYIGSGTPHAYFFGGIVSDVRIYDTALTAEEVGRIYAGTKDQYLAYE